MKRWYAVVAGLLLTATAAQAHFVWLVPQKGDATKASVLFSENLEPDDPALLDKIAKTRFFTFAPDAGKVPATATRKGDLMLVELPADATTLAGICEYGVMQRGQSKPFLLNYYSKLLVRGVDAAKPCAELPLDVIPAISAKGVAVMVLFQGQPAVNAEVLILAPGSKAGEPFKTDSNGLVKLGTAPAGTYGVRARHIEEAAGELSGKKYEEIRHYSTVVFDTTSAQAAAKNSRKENPEASRLLADARAARVNWKNFRGFTADLEVNIDGKAVKGKLQVDDRGVVSLEGLDKPSESWAKRTLSSIVQHRTDGAAEMKTPCAFADEHENHPLGRAIVVLSDELHSSYRIRDRQITVVNRDMMGTKFSITTLENRKNEEGQFLPTSFVLHFWDKAGAIQRTEAHHQSWTRIGTFDLPSEIRVIFGGKELSAKALTLSNHKLP